MCGILFAINHNNISVSNLVGNIYDAQKNRGRNGFGFLEILDDEVKHHTYVLEKDMLDALGKSKSNHILFHHRIPTSTTNNVVSNHPIFTDWEGYEHNYYLIHNGHIGNCDELRKEHEKYGIKYTTDEGSSFTDSESLLHEVALIVEGHNEPKEFAATGGLAFIMVQTDKHNNPVALYYGRNYSNPLKIQKTENVFVLRSECATGEIVTPNRLYRYDYTTKEITEKEVIFGKESWYSIHKEVEYSPFVNAMMGLYEHKYVTYLELDKLKQSELNTLIVVAKRVAYNSSIELERKLLTSPKEELAMLRAYYTATMRTINLIELKLK